eukprot:1359820-Ditylum_brightwellii.AAC.1
MEARTSMMLGLNKMHIITFITSLRLMEVVAMLLVQLRKEGIKEANDFTEFDKGMWMQVSENLKCPGGWMKNLEKNAKKTPKVPQTPYLFGAKIQKRLLEAFKLM